MEEGMADARYQFLSKLGEGGMGRVHLVEDQVRKERLALKELLPGGRESKRIAYFEREYQIMRALQHENTLRVYDYGLGEQGLPYFTMEYVEGRALGEVEWSSLDEILDVVEQIALALSFMHDRLFVHRDLKPSNIRITSEGQVKILDFGLASQLGVVVQGKVSGTPQYLAPEAIVGGVIDGRTDIYSLGVLTYELLTGGVLFSGTRDEVLRAQLEEQPVPVEELRPDLPASLVSLVNQMLAKAQRQRPSDMGEVLSVIASLRGREHVVEGHAHRESYLYSTKLVGRDDEFARLERSLEGLAQGQGGAWLVTAAAGVGKSRLAEELKASAALRRMQTLWVDALNTRKGPYGWVAEWVHQLALLVGGEQLDRLGPALALHAPTLAENYQAQGDEAQFKEAFEALVRAASSPRPLVIFIDDLQWMDVQSQQIFNDLVRKLSRVSAATLLVATVRVEDALPAPRPCGRPSKRA